MLAALAGACGVLATAFVALVIDHRRRRDRQESDVWRAINSLRDRISENNEFLAEIKGLLTGLFREVLDDPEVWRPPRKRAREGPDRPANPLRQRSVDT